jgi:DNA invertase Pin-like site-specific DNA recombinase
MKLTHKQPLRAAIYARVSTSDQRTDMQLTELREYCARMGWELATEYQEKASSVKKRPEFERMMSAAQLRKFDVLVVWKIDRIARSTRQFIDTVLELDGRGIRFVCPTQGIDSDRQSPSGKLLMHILAAFAEFERSIIVERVRAGVAEAQRQGKHCGRPKKIFRRDEARRLRAAGMSLRAIARELDISVMTVSRVLKP